MKYFLIAVLIIFSPIITTAQKHHLYTDIGICGARLLPGLSVTYNYRPVKFIGLGVGAQVYDFYPTIADRARFTPALYGDLRVNIMPKKKNQFFLFLDIGANFYKPTGRNYVDGTVVYTDNDDNGIYTGIGLGYIRQIQKIGLFYTSLKMISNGSKAEAYDLITQEDYVQSFERGTIVLSFGVKF